MQNRLNRESCNDGRFWFMLAGGCLLLAVSVFLLLFPGGADFPVMYAGMAIFGFGMTLRAGDELLPTNAGKLPLLRLLAIALLAVGGAVMMMAVPPIMS